MTPIDRISADRVRFAALLNDLPEDSPMPIDLAGWELRWATLEEKNELRGPIRSYAASFFGSPPQELSIEIDGDGLSFRGLPDASQWRYAVVEPRNPSILGAHLAEALRVSTNDLWIDLWHTHPVGPRGIQMAPGGNAAQCASFFRSDRYYQPRQLDVSELEQVLNLRVTFDDAAFPEISSMLALFRELDSVPETSRLKLLGYFSILEGLLTHNPKPGDLVDSIRKQLSRNLLLLSHRTDSTHPYLLESFENSKGWDQVSARLYSVRSAIAHGSLSGSDGAWLDERRPHAYAEYPPGAWLYRFMRLLTKNVLISAMREPQLIQDLKG
jgi:hypothetical protein